MRWHGRRVAVYAYGAPADMRKGFDGRAGATIAGPSATAGALGAKTAVSDRTARSPKNRPRRKRQERRPASRQGYSLPLDSTVDAIDLVTKSPGCHITKVASNEPRRHQWTITGFLSLDLVASRQGHGRGRIYSIAVTCTEEPAMCRDARQRPSGAPRSSQRQSSLVSLTRHATGGSRTNSWPVSANAKG
jgi:hypothetical protein